MKILIDIGHPAHVHYFKHVIQNARDEGHEVVISAREKDVTIALLDAYGLDHCVLSASGSGWLGLACEFVQREIGLFRLIRKFKPDVIAAAGGAFIAPIGRLTSTPTVVLIDTEHAATDCYLSYPWATRICTPDAFKKDLGPKQHRYTGYLELAHLDPNRFRSNPSVLNMLGLTEAERFSVLRFISWQASHDRGEKGFSDELKERAVERLQRHGPVFICAEGPLPRQLEKYKLRTPPHLFHDILAAASLQFGEGATTATEAALVGTPSVYLSSLVGTMGNFEVLGAEGLVLSYRDGGEALDRAETLLCDETAKPLWKDRAKRFCARHTDVAKFIYDQILEEALANRQG